MSQSSSADCFSPTDIPEIPDDRSQPFAIVVKGGWFLSAAGDMMKEGNTADEVEKAFATSLRDKLFQALVRYGEATGQPFATSDPYGSWILATLALRRKDKGVNRAKANRARQSVLKLITKAAPTIDAEEALDDEWPEFISWEEAP